MAIRYSDCPADVLDLLTAAQAGVFCTVNSDTSPYGVPMNFVFCPEGFFLHSGKKGTKLKNIWARKQVCFTVFDMRSVVVPENAQSACDVGAAFISAVVTGEAVIVDDTQKKRNALRAISEKYAPQLAGMPFDEKIMDATAVIEIIPESITSKSRHVRH